MLHSKLGMGERYDEWQRLRRGEARICVGPRSAVFAPLRDVGLIVVDEEHDSAYKQESDPRYDARRVAARRAEQAGAVLALRQRDAAPGELARDAPARASGAHRAAGRCRRSSCSTCAGCDTRCTRDARAALEEVEAAWRQGDRARQPARAGRRFLRLPLVRPRLELPALRRDAHAPPPRAIASACSATTAAHREPVPSTCPSCRSTAIARHGTGTQRVEAELREALEPLPVFRLDARRGSPQARHRRRARAAFDQAPSGVLVGTQMVAQGHDFPEVELADRAGRGRRASLPRLSRRGAHLHARLAARGTQRPRARRRPVLVQTLSPETPCLQHAVRHDAAAFLEEELARRRALRYPPFSRLIRVVTAAPASRPRPIAAAERDPLPS